jgi:hypothetical protein
MGTEVIFFFWLIADDRGVLIAFLAGIRSEITDSSGKVRSSQFSQNIILVVNP